MWVTTLKIVKLEKHVIEQIAAGEVVQRPASVVKELIENSIDAGATRIEVRIKKGGKQLIEVADNGEGMTREDALLAFERHTTSKLRTIDDLDHLSTLGFRGEALASIALVSKATMVTRTVTDTLGTKVRIEGGDIKSVDSIGCSVGTTITINALFYNVPARRKFLKADNREQSHIYDVVSQYSLIHPHIGFQLDSEKRNLITSPAARDPLDKIVYIYGREVARDLIWIDYADPLKVEGFLSKPKISHRTRNRLHIYVSSRLVKSKVLEDTVIAAYQRLLPKDRYPLCVLNIEIAPEQIDVNIHPTKREIRFHDERNLRKKLLKIFKDALKAADLLPEVIPEVTHRPFLDEMGASRSSLNASAARAVPSSSGSQTPPSHEKPTVQTRISLKGSADSEKPAIPTPSSSKVPSILEKPGISGIDTTEPKMRELPWTPLGVIKNSYIVAYDAESVYFVDQHAAFERIMFDELTEQVRHSTIKSQELLHPATVTLPPPRARVLKENLPVFSTFGFRIEEFGRDTFLIRSVPVIYGRVIHAEALDDLLDELLEKGGFSSLPSEKEIIQSIACHTVVRAGDPLTPRQIVDLLKRLHRSQDLFACPHGRPITIQIPIHDLEKMFRRI